MLEERELISGIVLGIVGLISNIAEVILLCCQKTRRTKYQNVIFSLSSADICTCLFSLLCFIYLNFGVTSKGRPDHIIYVIAQELLWFSVSSSLLHVLAVSFDRLLAVRYPVKHRFWFTHKKNKRLIIVIWVLSFLLILPTMLVRLHKGKSYIPQLVTSSLVLLTGLLIIFLYAYIIRKTVSKECIFEIITLQSGKKEVISACSMREKRILMTTVLIVISFIVCSFPFAITYILTKSMNYTMLLLISNTILNPIIYFFHRYYQDQKDETVRRKTRQETEVKTTHPQPRKDIPLPEMDIVEPKENGVFKDQIQTCV